jgi:hypothetical protein
LHVPAQPALRHTNGQVISLFQRPSFPQERTIKPLHSRVTGGSTTKICGASRPDKGGPACRTLYDQAQTAKHLMIGGFALAGALAVASIVGFVASSSEAEAVALPAVGVDRTSVRLDWAMRF